MKSEIIAGIVNYAEMVPITGRHVVSAIGIAAVAVCFIVNDMIHHNYKIECKGFVFAPTNSYPLTKSL